MQLERRFRDLKEMTKIVQVIPLSTQSMTNLMLLYYPLMNRESIALYALMNSLCNQDIEQDVLLSLSGMGHSSFVRARKYLEQFNLLKTYHGQDAWIYHLYAPLSASAFLSHDTYSRMFFQSVGSVRFDYIRTLLLKNQKLPKGFEEVSESIDLSSLENWSDEKENMHASMAPKEKEDRKYNFNFDEFLTGMEQIFPLRMRSKETMHRIGQLADIHGIDAKEMKKYVMRSINPRTHYFDWEHLKNQIYKNKSIQTKQEGYSMAPVQFFSRMQNGAPVAKADRVLIERLCTEYHFPNEVVNILIEYTLKQTNQQFPRSYVEKVASSWVRQGIDSKEKALAAIQKPNKKTVTKQKDYPEWYKNTEQHDASQELIDEVNAMLEGLGGKNDE